MRPFNLRLLTDLEAASGGDSLLAGVLVVANAPSNTTSPYVSVFPTLVSQAQAAQPKLLAASTAFASAAAAHADKIAAALAEEKPLETACSALYTRLLAEVKAGAPGAKELLKLLFPRGLGAVTKPRGRPQLAACKALADKLAHESATSSPAYAAIVGAVAAFLAQLDSFSRTIQAKNALESAEDDARDARNAARKDWMTVFGRLIDAAADIHGEESRAYQGWIQPLLDLRSTQKAVDARASSARPPSADTPSDGGQSGG